MNKRQKEVIQHQFDSEKEVLDRLAKQYQRALWDIDIKIRVLQSDELTQSKIYRIEYQKALKKQVEAILEKLHSDEYTTIQQFLSDSYTDGFVGSAYDMFGQGVPLIMPIDKNAAVKAVITDSQISEGLYETLGVDTKKLKTAISSEITRGIASGLPHSDIARNIAAYAKAPLSRAKTIVRTESHRIQQASAYDAQKTAVSKGAKVVKQWMSTLDGKTRSTHRKLDGQIREVDEPFELGGMKAMYPGDFGDPAEDCNCRCQLLQRARLALDEEELNTLKQRAEYFGLDKSDDLEDFKKKYLKAADDPYVNMSFMQKKELIYTNEQKIDRLRKEKKQAELEGIMASSADEMSSAFAKAKDIQRQIEEITVENDNIQKVLGLPTNAKERFFAQNIDLKTLPHDIRTEDYDAISSWTRSGYVDINRYMRYGDKGVRSQTISDAHAIEKCLERNIVKEPFTVKRGINTRAMDSWFGGESWRKEGFNPNGAVIVDKGFCATSPALHGGFGGDVVAYIDIPAGAKGAYIADVSGSKNEEEFLLQCGTCFRIDRVDITYDQWDEPHYDVYLKVIIDE